MSGRTLARARLHGHAKEPDRITREVRLRYLRRDPIECPRGGRGAGLHAKLLEDIPQALVHCPEAYAEDKPDLGVGFPCGDPQQDLASRRVRPSASNDAGRMARYCTSLSALR